MRARQPVPEGLTRLAALQAGVVSREQVLGTGFGAAGLNRLVRSGAWVRVSSGIYLTAAIPLDWPALAWAGVLIGGDAARLGGLSAAYLHQLAPDPPAQLEVLVPSSAGPPTVTGPWYFRRERDGVRSRAWSGSPPRLTVEDTVVDLINDPDCDPRSAVNWLTVAVQARKTTPERILRVARGRHFVRQRALLEDVLADVRDGVRSPIELDYLRNVERPHGLPEGRRQAKRGSTEIDVLYDEFALVVELDGRLGHTGMGRFRDMRRDNSATTDGLATLRYGHADVFGLPCEVALEVASNLIRRGWTGIPTRCDHCLRAA
ncbi:MAG TPA: type IV toxin-antitoxin system AbiEi family antitoxin domain-containing protein [Propionibacteriaceae bacterium]|nr:type IV toxin-antitoxin system AbiEi family antitoxin domain-containing protein [Propionibacteriaceae bacterium]